MSYDLHVYGMRALAPSELARLLSSSRGARAVTDPASGSILEVVTRFGSRHLFTVDGPFDVDAEDLLAQPLAVRRARVLYSFVASGSSRSAISAAVVAANLLASSIDGSVVDPQNEVDSEPVESLPESAPAKQYLHMMWYRTLDGRSDLAREFLAAARETFSPAVPARFGTHEPMQGKFPRDDDTEFDRIYREHGALSGMFFTGRGMRGGMNGWSNDFVARIEVARVHIDLASLSRANTARIRPFFESLARRADCDYAIASVNDWRTWPAPVMSGGIWAGVTPEPVWMTWCSPEYAAMIRPYFARGEVSDLPEGLLHQWTPEPVSSEDLLAQIDRTPWAAPDLIAAFDPPSGDLIQRAKRMPERLRPLAPDSPEALRIQANIARNRAMERRP